MGEAIPESRIKKLDSMFEAFSIVAEGTYVYICDMRYDYSRWSKTAVDAFDLPGEYMYNAGGIWEEHIHPEDRQIYHDGIDAIFNGNESGHDMQYRARKVNGEYDVCTCRGVVLMDDEGNPEYFGGVIRNHGVQGHIDALTGLRNQYGFFEDLNTHICRNTEVCIGMVGVSKFTEINEVYGYDFGNRILQKVGRYLLEHIGNTGSVYRLDGTKFAVISSTRTADEMKEQYEDLRSQFRNDFSIDGQALILDLNAGLLKLDNFAVDVQTIYSCLNFAYGESKIRRQGELVEFYNELTDENRQRIEKLNVIRASINNNFEGFFIMYQPVVDAHTEQLIGAEALIRWRNSTYGMVPPDHFIPLLERDALFPKLGKWILEKSLTDAKKILAGNPDFVINVNLSYSQLERPDFTDMVLETLDRTGYPPEHLCLEVTERCRLLDMTLLKNIVVNLRARGIKIALDDFGTGFSSMGIVKNLPFDTIKIDRSFVMRVEEDEKEKALVRHFISVATTFGAKVCVEGIETTGMKDILQKYKIQSFQGYYYSKPMELTDFLDWVEKR